MDRRYTWKPDLPDMRDRPYRAAPGDPPVEPTCWLLDLFRKKKYPDVVDLRKPGTWPAVFDQGPLGDCVENAWVAAMAYALALEGMGPQVLSRLMLYYEVRGGVPSDEGSTIRDGIKTMARVGDCKETSWPYDLGRWTEQPPAACYSEAMARRAVVYSRLSTIEDMEHCLASGFPFVYGMSVYEDFEELSGVNSVLPMPTPSDAFLGGHALCVLGMNRQRRLFLVRNSWGTSWGDDGFFWLPYAYAEDRDLSDDYWTVRTVPGVKLAA